MTKREDWKRPTQAMRRSKQRNVTLSPEVHEALDQLPQNTVSPHVDAACREYLGLPPRGDAPPKPPPRDPTP